MIKGTKRTRADLFYLQKPYLIKAIEIMNVSMLPFAMVDTILLHGQFHPSKN